VRAARTWPVLLAFLLPAGSGAADAPEVPAVPDAVKMGSVEVKSDPFRTLGLHGELTANLVGSVHLFVEGVNPGSPSAKNGLQAGDEVIALGGKPVNLATAFSFRSMVKDALAHGASIPAVVRPIHGTATRQVVLGAMVEPRRRWLPLAQMVAIDLPLRDPIPPPHGNAFCEATWVDQGEATPQAALESVFARLCRGDGAGIAGALEILGSAQTVGMALFQSLPAAGRTYYGSPEKMLAAFLIQEERPKWVYIRKLTTPKPDLAAFDVDEQFWSNYDHRKLRKTLLFHRTGQGWRWAISTHSIREYADYYRGVPFELAPPAVVPSIVWFFHSN
jgi:hypothetical protein